MLPESNYNHQYSIVERFPRDSLRYLSRLDIIVSVAVTQDQFLMVSFSLLFSFALK